MKPARLVIAAVVALASCTPASNAKGATDVQQNAAPAAAESAPVDSAPQAQAAAAPVVRASSVSKLASLGLQVFPKAQPIPEVTLKNLKGETVSVSDLKGKVVFLNFWATWCPPCRAEMPSIEKLYKHMEGKDFAVFAVSSQEDPKTVSTFLDATPYSFPIALDPSGSVASVFAGRGIPTTYILDKEGLAVAGIIGARQWDTPEVYSILETLAAE